MYCSVLLYIYIYIYEVACHDVIRWVLQSESLAVCVSVRVAVYCSVRCSMLQCDGVFGMSRSTTQSVRLSVCVYVCVYIVFYV